MATAGENIHKVRPLGVSLCCEQDRCAINVRPITDEEMAQKRELGRHAFEKRMPERVARLIETDSAKNKTAGIVPALASLLASDRDTHRAALCHKAAVQMSKRRGEGDFCGYRTMQMLLPAPHPIYSIPELQSMIEKAWDQGFNAHGRVETQGIKGTRKYIGTSEAQALFQSLGVSCCAAIFTGENAWCELLDAVETYFVSPSSRPGQQSSSAAKESLTASGKVHVTKKAPVFLQRPGHSVAIVGIERDAAGKRQLLVFDSAYQPPTSTLKFASLSAFFNRIALFPYRRDERYLKRYRAFEILMLTDASYRPSGSQR